MVVIKKTVRKWHFHHKKMGKIIFLGKKDKKRVKRKKFRPNLSLGVCLAMCLFFEQTEPSVLINCVLTKKNKCIGLPGSLAPPPGVK